MGSKSKLGFMNFNKSTKKEIEQKKKSKKENAPDIISKSLLISTHLRRLNYQGLF